MTSMKELLSKREVEDINQRIDGRRNARVKKGKVLKAEWMDSEYLHHFLVNLVGNEQCLNVCCGSSTIGQWRLDISENSNRTAEGDLFQIWKYFRPNSMPFVLCDMPFHYLNPLDPYIQKKGKELIEAGVNLSAPGSLAYEIQFWLYDIASKGLILKRNLQSPAIFPCKYQEYFISKDTRPSMILTEVTWK